MKRLSNAVWEELLGHVRLRYPGATRGWFGRLRPGELYGGDLTVYAASDDQRTYLVEHCIRPFVEAAQAVTGRLVSVTFAVANRPGGRDVDPAGPTHAEPESTVLRLNADYRFDQFVTGPCNQLAHASALAVADAPGQVYSPLFIHGGVGLGKTHLLHAVCHRVLDQAPATRVIYLSCEAFMNHFIEAIEHGTMQRFRDRHRRVDLLIIDDIQFLAGHDRTQEEFFHTFNALYQFKKQIILAADCPPSSLPDLEDRLISRFNWGLVARIDPPTLETRLAIVRKKAKLRGVHLPADAGMLIATRIKSNTRELEGALTRIQSLAALANSQIDRSLVDSALRDEAGDQPRDVRIQEIMNLVTEVFGVKVSDIQGRRRTRSIALPRQVCMYLARQFTKLSLEEIGGYLGGRDHSTVLHANKLIAHRRENDIAFRTRLESLESTLRNRRPVVSAVDKM